MDREIFFLCKSLGLSVNREILPVMAVITIRIFISLTDMPVVQSTLHSECVSYRKDKFLFSISFSHAVLSTKVSNLTVRKKAVRGVEI